MAAARRTRSVSESSLSSVADEDEIIKLEEELDDEDEEDDDDDEDDEQDNDEDDDQDNDEEDQEDDEEDDEDKQEDQDDEDEVPQRKSRYQRTVVEHAYDERLAFPRNEYFEYAIMSSDEDYDESLMAALRDDGEDELSSDEIVDQAEGINIVQEMKGQEDDYEQGSNGDVEDEDDEDEDEDEDEDDDDEDNDQDDENVMEIIMTPGRTRRGSRAHLADSDDDSFLWSYLFTSGESDSEDRYEVYSHVSGDSTDEDTNLPPPSARRRFRTRATEVLSNTSRPPVLGSWVMNRERPFGIIDGTRTLGPPEARSGSGSGPGPTRRRSDSEASELALDDFIYMSDLELDDPSPPATAFTTPVSWKTLFNPDVPLSAFRNRGVHTPSSHPASGRRYSAASIGSGRRRRTSVLGSARVQKREAHMTPVRVARYKARRLPSPSSPSALEPTDLIDELVEIGALSPLFGGL